MTDRQRYVGIGDDDFYWERVKRNLGWLGNTEQEQRERQQRLKDVRVGVAGVGGIGGATAERLVRMGVQNLKLADPDTFEASNINRQFAATLDNLGRNKAEAVAEAVYDTTRDVTIEVYPEGIVEDTVDEFLADCDVVLDKIELYELDARYTLHRAFRRSPWVRFMMLTPVFGHRTFFFTWTHDSMTAEDYFGIPFGKPMDRDTASQLISRFIPEMPDYPDRSTLDQWFVEDLTCPIFAGTPPLAQGMLASRLGQAITGLDQLPGSAPLPVTPGYAMIDTQRWEMKRVEGVWWDQ